MREQIVTTAVWCDKTETLGIVEPLHYTGCHDVLSELNNMSADLWAVWPPTGQVLRIPRQGECRSYIVAKLPDRQEKLVYIGAGRDSGLLGCTLELEASADRHNPALRVDHLGSDVFNLDFPGPSG